MNAIAVVRNGQPLGVALTAEEARHMILTAHDGLDWEIWGAHPYHLASGQCGCGLTEDLLSQLDGRGPWGAGRLREGAPYWTAHPLTPA